MKRILVCIMALIALVACNNKKETKKEEPVAPVSNPAVTEWMSWEGGVDVVAVTDTSLKMPNIIFHVARMVHTPVGSAPSGMLLYQPDSTKPPVVMGFISTDTLVGKYFGPNIFKGTPFENAPVLPATFDIKYDGTMATAKVVASGQTFECTMTNLGNPYLIHRAPATMPPFYQQGVERTAGQVTLKINGQEVKMIIPPVGISGGPAAVVAPNGVYAR